MGSFLISLTFTICILISTCPLTSSTTDTSTISSIYDLLHSHGLPIGLLPKGVTNFTIDPSTGHFEVYLDSICDTNFESHVRFNLNVSGTLRFGEIAELSGVAAEDLFLWFPVKGIRVDIPSSGLIYFDVGVVFKQFSLSSFETPRDCIVLGLDSPQLDLFLFNDHGRIVE
ncbi:unnamed protein product, partial [Ilex paraguariensis]